MFFKSGFAHVALYFSVPFGPVVKLTRKTGAGNSEGIHQYSFVPYAMTMLACSNKSEIAAKIYFQWPQFVLILRNLPFVIQDIAIAWFHRNWSVIIQTVVTIWMRHPSLIGSLLTHYARYITTTAFTLTRWPWFIIILQNNRSNCLPFLVQTFK